jgi:parallel beta-helix repeat protein
MLGDVMLSLRILASLALLAVVSCLAFAQDRSLAQGDVISRTSKIAKRTYLIESEADENGRAAISVAGDGITVDFQGATLMGSPADTEPNERQGVGIEVHGKNVTIKNLRVRGYKVGLIARNCPGLKLLDSDFSYNWKQHLMSTLDREDESDWMSYHQNEKDEWLGYGAGIYLRGCTDFEIRGNTAQGGQCGLMMTQCDRGLIWNNDFSFLSGIGIGLYRSSDNRVMYNKVDWCVRGYSHGVYNRGQDSAGILIYEQSNHNTFAYNSVTHGGDGFFLWAGQTTMDTGKGGCNDNLLYGNDWSHAPTNGIEATFSRNTFANNLVLECWHGIWGGYSYNTKVVGNVFGFNAEGIAWEHGQDNLLDRNLFLRDNAAIDIWANKTQDPNWVYAKVRDTKSRDWTIRNNIFDNVSKSSLSFTRTSNVTLQGNRFIHCGNPLILLGNNVAGLTVDATNVSDSQKMDFSKSTDDKTTANYDIRDTNSAPAPPTMEPSGNPVANDDPDPIAYLKRFDVTWDPFTTRDASRREVEALAPSQLKGGKNPFIKPGQLRGRRYILVDEWGPYDFKRPILWPRGEVPSANPLAIVAGSDHPVSQTTIRRFEILGPKGRWRALKASGAELSAQEGSVPGMVDVTLPAGKAGTTDIELEYLGGETTDYLGNVTAAGKPVTFGYSKFFAPIEWLVRWYAWDPKAVSSPRDKMPAAETILSKAQMESPLKQERTDRLDYSWGGSPGAPVPADHFITLASGTFEIPSGNYTIDMTTDDGARLWLDDKLIIDQWHYQGPTLYSKDVSLTGGKHTIRVDHYEIDGYSALKVELRPTKKK